MGDFSSVDIGEVVLIFEVVIFIVLGFRVSVT